MSRGGPRPHPHEVVLAAYLAAVALLALALGRPVTRWWPSAAAYAAGAVVLVLVMPRLPQTAPVRVLRDWLPMAAVPFLYGDIARLNDLVAQGYHDAAVQRLELALFHGQPSVVWRQYLPWRPLAEYLHIGYLSYYVLLPGLGLALYLPRRLDEYRLALTTVLLVFAVCYLVYIVYPVAGPWYNFARPDPASLGWVAPRWVHGVLERGASKGAAFPSSHVAVATVVWLLAGRFVPPLFVVYSALVPALAFGTVYGGFHYLVDSIAGWAVGVLCYWAGPRLYRRLRAGHGTRRSAPAPGAPVARSAR